MYTHGHGQYQIVHVKNLHCNAKENILDVFFLFKGFILKKMYIPGGNFQTNCFFKIYYRHGSHVTLEAIK